MNLTGSISFHPEEVNYFQIKSSEKSEWETIELFYEKRCAKNSKVHFTHDQMKKCRFKYRNAEYKYSDLGNNTVNALEIPTFCTNRLKYNPVFYCEKKNGYILRLLDTLDRYLLKARFEAIKAATIFDIYYLYSTVSPKSYDWFYKQRCFYAENAIYSYYSSYEILSLIVWISRNYMGKKCDTFEKVCKSCQSYMLRKNLKKSNDDLFLVMAEAGSDQAINSKFKCVTDWCNTFKHRGILRFTGEKMVDRPTTSFIPTTCGSLSGLAPCSTEDWEYQYIDLDTEVIPALISYHKDIISTADIVIKNVLQKIGVK